MTAGVTELLRKSLETETPVPEALHRRMKQLFLQYTCIYTLNTSSCALPSSGSSVIIRLRHLTIIPASSIHCMRPAECTLVEVKAATGNAKSVKTILRHPEKYHVGSAIKLGDYHIGRAGQVLTLPLYMAFLLREV